MEVFVVVALAVAVLAAGLVVVSAIVLRRQFGLLRGALRHTTEQVRALTEELGDEAAVLALETEALQRRLEAPRRAR